MGVYEEDLDADAIAKCSRALSVLDDKARIRVFKFLLDKFEIIEQSSFVAPTTTKQQQPTNIAIEPIINSSVSEIANVLVPDNNQEIPSLYGLITKGYAKSESDILLMVIYNKSNFGKIAIERQDILDGYKEYEIETSSRAKNLTPNLERLIKASYVTAITKTKFSVSDPEGLEQIKLIVSGNSLSKTKTKTNIKTKKKINSDD